MAEKPKTYPQQIQELKQQLEDAITDKHDAERQASFIPELQEEIEFLKDKLDQSSSINMQAVRTDKAVTNDLEQRAVSAEQGIRNLQVANNDLKLQIQQLESALDVAGKERDRSLGLERKLELVAEELKTANLRIANLNQQIRDKSTEAQANVDSVQSELRQLRMYNQSLTKLVNELRSTIQQAPDVLGQLRIIAGL